MRDIWHGNLIKSGVVTVVNARVTTINIESIIFVNQKIIYKRSHYIYATRPNSYFILKPVPKNTLYIVKAIKNVGITVLLLVVPHSKLRGWPKTRSNWSQNPRKNQIAILVCKWQGWKYTTERRRSKRYQEEPCSSWACRRWRSCRCWRSIHDQSLSRVQIKQIGSRQAVTLLEHVVKISAPSLKKVMLSCGIRRPDFLLVDPSVGNTNISLLNEMLNYFSFANTCRLTRSGIDLG